MNSYSNWKQLKTIISIKNNNTSNGNNCTNIFHDILLNDLIQKL